MKPSQLTAVMCVFSMVALMGCSSGKKTKTTSTVTPSKTPKAVVKPKVQKVQPKKIEAKKTFHDPFLYKIEGKNGPTYLMGTIHLAVNPKTDLSPVVWDTLEKSKAFVMETDTSKAQATMAKAMLQPKGKTLQSALGKDCLLYTSPSPRD